MHRSPVQGLLLRLVGLRALPGGMAVNLPDCPYLFEYIMPQCTALHVGDTMPAPCEAILDLELCPEGWR